MRRIKCDDVNCRKFILIVKDDAEVIDAEWITKQNEIRAKAGRTAIVKWEVDALYWR